MKNKNINEQLQLFANDNFKMNFHENVEGYSNSELASNSEDEIISIPEESVPTGKSEANLKNKKNLEETINEIRNFAYSYLEKYSPSKQQLTTYLFKKLIKKKQNITSKKEIFNLIDIVISSLVNQKLLSDKYYSDAKSKAFLRKGYSLNKIRYNLIKKGIDDKYIKASISKIKEKESDPDFFSAIKLCKRRRIGPSRDENNRPLFYKKDISLLARSGFGYELSKKI